MLDLCFYDYILIVVQDVLFLSVLDLSYCVFVLLLYWRNNKQTNYMARYRPTV